MAVIQKIRNKYGKIAGGLIALSLVGFILMDAERGSFGDFFGHDSSIAKVNGKKIDYKDFTERTKEYESLYTTYKSKNIDDNTRAELNTQALDNMIYEDVVSAQCEKLGLQTTKEEEKEIIYGNYPDMIVQQFPYFADQDTKQFNPQYIKAFEEQADKLDPSGKILQDWFNIKNYVVRNNTISKFSQAIMASAYTPKFVLDRIIKDENEKASIRYVKVPYISVADNEVKVTDEDITNYMKQHPGMFKISETMRSIQYVSFDVVPSHDDTAKVMDMLTKAKTDLIKADPKDVESVVNRNSDEKYNSAFVNSRSANNPFIDSILKLPVGSVYGPYFDKGSYKITRVVEKKDLPDSATGNVIMLAVSAQGKEIMPDSVAKLKLDSVQNALKAGVDFKTLAQKYSMDKYTNKDGKFTYSLEQKDILPKDYAKFLFETGKPGDKKIIRDSSEDLVAYFYVELNTQTSPKPAAVLGTVSRELAPGEATQNAAYSMANNFAGKNATAAAFDEAAKKEGLNVKNADGVKPGDFAVGGIGPNRELVRWMYEAKLNDVSGVFPLENKYVVAKLSNILEKGPMQITESMRPRLEATVKQQKKYELIASKYKGSANLDAIANASNGHVQEADSFSLGTPYIPNLGFEPKVQGYTFFSGLKPNMVSPGIRGGDGVLFISPITTWSIPVDQGTLNLQYSAMRDRQDGQNRNAIGQELREAIKQTANIKYNPKNM
jgi:hypothetical protein